MVVPASGSHHGLFWLSVGGERGPTMDRAMDQSYGAPLAFVLSFYLFSVGAKMLLAVVVGKSKAFLSGPLYRVIMGLFGMGLGGLALLLFYDGFKLLLSSGL